MTERAYKKCARCKVDKWLDEFAITKSTGWRESYCAECAKLVKRLDATKARRKDLAAHASYQRQYRAGRVSMAPITTRGRTLSDL